VACIRSAAVSAAILRASRPQCEVAVQCCARKSEFARSLNPALQTFDQ